MVVRIYKSMHHSLFQGLTEAYVGPGAAQLLDANGQSLLGTVTTTPPAVTAAPTISGEAVEGSTLTGTVGTASGTPAPIAARQWLADGVTIAGATGASFDTTGRAGQAISLRVTWSNGTAPDAVSTSAAITVTAAPPQPVAPSAQTAPSISPATGPVGTVFTITEGTYAGTTPITIGGTLTQAGVDVTGECRATASPARPRECWSGPRRPATALRPMRRRPPARPWRRSRWSPSLPSPAPP
ncbi:MAG: hypothetical protein ACU0HS_00825 [Paracoccus sp. (in: a-proteobacteria)]|uniref:hypothetical protein n=1 Tax=Paracoccus sp. TaxID=267 RepID=UPI0040588B7F